MPDAKRPANGPAASARALARTSSAVAEKPKRVDFDAVHSREFSKKEGITDYVSRMKNKLGQSKHQASPAAPAAPAVTTSSGGLGIPARLLQKKRKDREESEKENEVAANGTVTRAGDLQQPTLKRARASISHHVARGGTVSQPTTPSAVRTTGSHRLVAGQEAAIDSRKRRMSYTPHRGPLPAYPQQSAAPLSTPVSAEALSTAISAAVAVAVASPARALVSPMRPVGTRVLHRSRTADLLDEEATLLEVHAPATTPIKRRRLELPEAGAEQDNNTTSVIAEAAAVINEAHALDTMTPLEAGEEDQTTVRPTKREGWRSVERKNGPRPEGRSQNRRHTVANRRILALIAEESQ
jgi:NAD(P)H-dependent FMN reductase